MFGVCASLLFLALRPFYSTSSLLTLLAVSISHLPSTWWLQRFAKSLPIKTHRKSAGSAADNCFDGSFESRTLSEHEEIVNMEWSSNDMAAACSLIAAKVQKNEFLLVILVQNEY